MGRWNVARPQDRNAMPVKEGWRGRFFEDFVVGDVYEHALGRTITTADNIWFTLLTQNTAPIHFDHHYAAQTEFGRPLVNSCLTLALGGAGASGFEIAQEHRHRHGAHDGHQPGRNRGDLVQAHGDDLPARSGSEEALGRWTSSCPNSRLRSAT